jgi:peroxiredoxin
MAQSSARFVLFGTALLAGLYLNRDTTVNQPAPAFSLSESYGARVDLHSYRGQPVLLVFWMTSCGICRRELPLLSAMAPEFRSQGIAVAAIHLGSREDARDYMRSNHIDLTSLADPDGTVAEAYHVSGVPKLVLVGADGRIKTTHAGMVGESTLREWMKL